MKHPDPASSSRTADSSRIDRHLRHTRQSRATKSRTSNACEACKRRKTKCSGGPSPCEVCKRAETFCNFNPKLDTRRKVSYSSTTVQDRQQFMLTGLLQTIKHIPQDDLHQLLNLIRESPRIDAVAACLRRHFATLQNRGIIPAYDVDDTDVISFGLQGLCGYRKGRAKPATSPSNKEQPLDGAESPTALSVDSYDSSEALDEASGKLKAEAEAPDTQSAEDDDLFDPVGVGDFDFTQPLHHHPLSPHEQSSAYSQHADESSHGSHSYTADSLSTSRSPDLPETLAAFSAHLPQQFYHQMQPHSSPMEAHNYGALMYGHPLANNVHTTLDPSLAFKSTVPGSLPAYSSGDVLGDFSSSNYAFLPLRSNA